MNIEHYGDNFVPVIPVDENAHTDVRPFCFDPTCPCHEDQNNIGIVAQHVTNGLMTPEEATDFVGGRGI